MMEKWVENVEHVGRIALVELSCPGEGGREGGVEDEDG